MNVEFAVAAEEDLQVIGDYIALDNQTRALSFTGELAGKAIDFGGTPLAWPLAAGLEHLGVRRRVYQDHLIFYRVDDERVLIVHIMHGARDYLALFDAEA